MPAKLPEGWLDFYDPSDFFEVRDRLHLARIHPEICHRQHRLCDANARRSLEEGDRKRVLCQRLADRRHSFPVAQCVLGLRKEEIEELKMEELEELGDGLFLKVMCQLRLLQTVVLTAQPPSRSYGSYDLQHLEKSVGLEIPWIRPRLSDNKPDFDKRRRPMNKSFHDFRTAKDVQEFVDLLESPTGEELLASGTVRGIDALKLDCLTHEEKQHHLLLVSDQEQSFFSLLFVLAAANDHAKERGGDSIEELQKWITEQPDHEGKIPKLRSELCHKDKTLDDSCPDDHPNTVDGGRFIEDRGWPPYHFWRASTFKEAVYALGFVKGRGRGDEEQTTERFKRLCRWLASPKAEIHPALKVKVCFHDEKQPLIKVLDFNESLLRKWQAEPGLDTLRSLCCHLIDRLSKACVKTKTGKCPLLDKAESFCRFRDAESSMPGVRFNIPGEYLLRKGESISRNFWLSGIFRG